MEYEGRTLKPSSLAIKIISVVSIFIVMAGIIILWIGTVNSEGKIIILSAILILPTLFIPVSNVFVLVSVYKNPSYYKLTIPAIIFSSVTLLGMFVNGIVFLFSLIFSEDERNLVSLLTIVSASFIITLSQILVLIVSSSETRRIFSSRKI